MYTLYHIIWFTSHSVPSRTDGHPWCHLPTTLKQTATRLPVLFCSRPPTLWTDPTCQASTRKLSQKCMWPIFVCFIYMQYHIIWFTSHGVHFQSHPILSFNSIYSKFFCFMYMLYHIIWFMSHGVHSQSGVTPGVTCPLPENKSATRLPFLFHSRPPTLWTDPTRQAK